jgi:hypothetical protein
VKQPSNNEKEKTDLPARRTTGIPKGVYRFKTLEEADEWERKMLARNNVFQSDSPPVKAGEQPSKA